jgi:hypothetical protein
MECENAFDGHKFLNPEKDDNGCGTGKERRTIRSRVERVRNCDTWSYLEAIGYSDSHGLSRLNRGHRSPLPGFSPITPFGRCGTTVLGKFERPNREPGVPPERRARAGRGKVSACMARK